MFIATVVYWINAEMGPLSDVRKAFRWHGFIHTVACGGHSLKKASPHAVVNSISKILLLRVIFLLFCPPGTMSNLLLHNFASQPLQQVLSVCSYHNNELGDIWTHFVLGSIKACPRGAMGALNYNACQVA